jgi:hypothetical protein
VDFSASAMSAERLISQIENKVRIRHKLHVPNEFSSGRSDHICGICILMLFRKSAVPHRSLEQLTIKVPPLLDANHHSELLSA